MKNIIWVLFVFFSLNAFAQDEGSIELAEIYFTKKDGVRISGTVSPDEKYVYLVIVSKNAQGEEVIITMDEDENYFYKKKFLSAGSSIRIPIKSDLEKVKLIIYDARKKKHVKKRMKEEGYTEAVDAIR